MKSFTMKIIFGLFMLLIASGVSFSQVDPATNVSGRKLNPSVPQVQPEVNNVYFGLTGIPCNQGQFWAVYGGQVYSFTLSGNTLTNNGAVVSGVGASLAYCNNLDGGGYSPTFYSNVTNTRAGYYNGSGWTHCAPQSQFWVLNAGGYGNYLYYTAHDSSTYQEIGIARYNGSAYTIIYHLPDTSRLITVADVAADELGNVWFFIGNSQTLVSDTLVVMSPSGQVIKKFPFSMNTDNAYGCFIMNNIIYIGLGSANPVHPNTLIPVTISGSSATPGTPIPMPGMTFADLASCAPGSPLGIPGEATVSSIKIYPNPATDLLHIEFANTADLPSSIRIINAQGIIMYEATSVREDQAIDISGFSPGIYLVSLDNFTLKIVKK